MIGKGEASERPGGAELDTGSSEPVQFVSEKLLHSGFRFRVTEVIERTPDGVDRKREIVRHDGAAVILPVLDDGRIVLVEQYRTALGRSILELPAGGLEPGEDPAESAERELVEETGYRAASIRPLVRFFPAPGITDEEMHVFVATGLTPGAPQPDEGEIVETRLLTLEEIRERMLAGEIIDGKTMLSVMYVMMLGLDAGGSNANEEVGG